MCTHKYITSDLYGRLLASSINNNNNLRHPTTSINKVFFFCLFYRNYFSLKRILFYAARISWSYNIIIAVGVWM